MANNWIHKNRHCKTVNTNFYSIIYGITDRFASNKLRFFEIEEAFTLAKETPRMAFAPNLDLLRVPSRSMSV